MPRLIPAPTLVELQRTHAAVAQLIALDTDPVTRWCQPWSEGRSLWIDGDEYVPVPFSVTAEQPGPVESASATFVVANHEGTVSTLIIAGVDLNELTLTYTVLAKETWEDDWEEEYVPFVAEIATASGTPAAWTLVAGVVQSLHHQAGLRLGEVYCQHRYKGIWCQYAGAEVTCDRRYETCLARGNQQHYGGLRLAPRSGDTFTLGGQPYTVLGDPYGGTWRPADQAGVSAGVGVMSGPFGRPLQPAPLSWRYGPRQITDAPPPLPPSSTPAGD